MVNEAAHRFSEVALRRRLPRVHNILKRLRVHHGDSLVAMLVPKAL